MAGAMEYWIHAHKSTKIDFTQPYVYDSCIFHQQCYEYCKVIRSGWTYLGFRAQHIDYLTRLLLDSLLKHDFTKSAHCISALSGSMKFVSELLWRTGCQVLMSLHANHARRVQFFKYIFMLCFPYQEEILLDFAMYLVKEHKNLTEASELLNGQATKKPLSDNKLIQAYMGMFEHVLWKINFKKQRLLHRNIDMDVEDNDIPKQSSNMYHGNKALRFFCNLFNSEGVWDIFVLRQVELLMFFERNDEAQRILERYREKNPENPNAHRYLYYFHKKQDSPKATLLSVLEDLFVVNPTSELVQEYHEMVMDNDSLSGYQKNICTLVGILFNKLDYHSCKNNLAGWKTLAYILDIYYHSNPTNKDINNKVKECWDERSDWWPGYHFSVSMVTRTLCKNDFSVIIEKAKVAKYLTSEEHAFVKGVEALEDRKGEEMQVDANCSVSDSDTIKLHRKSKRKVQNTQRNSPRKKIREI